MTGGHAAAVPSTREVAVGLARAFGGAIFFSLPLLMTMEMWWLGFYMDPWRLLLLMLVIIPLLIGLDHYSGFRDTSSWGEDVVDGLVAYGVGIVASAVVLVLLGVLTPEMPPREWVGKIALQAVPAAFGAVLASSQLGGENDEEESEGADMDAGYGAELLLMVAGALFLAFNLAPTEEMILIAFRMSTWHAIALVVVSLAMMHAFVHNVGFRGTHSAPEGVPGWSVFLRFTAVGYALALLVSAYVLWTFGRFDSGGQTLLAMETVVLAFPASLGAAAARLVI